MNGNYALIGSNDQAYLFDLTTKLLLHAFDQPGSSVALDGNHALVGACYDDTLGYDVGRAFLYAVAEVARDIHVVVYRELDRSPMQRDIGIRGFPDLRSETQSIDQYIFVG